MNSRVAGLQLTMRPLGPLMTSGCGTRASTVSARLRNDDVSVSARRLMRSIRIQMRHVIAPMIANAVLLGAASFRGAVAKRTATPPATTRPVDQVRGKPGQL